MGNGFGLFQIHNMIEMILDNPSDWKDILARLVGRIDAEMLFIRAAHGLRNRLDRCKEVTFSEIVKQGKIMSTNTEDELPIILGRGILWCARRCIRVRLKDPAVSDFDKDRYRNLRIVYDLF